MKFKAVIFDLDGTILNSLPDIANTVNFVLKEYNLPTHSLEDISKMVGNGFRILLQRAVPAHILDNPSLFDEIEERGRHHYGQNLTIASSLYDGVNICLDKLTEKDILLNINTNKPHDMVQPIVNHYFTNWEFKHAIGQIKGEPIKPDPKFANEISSKLGIDPKEIAFVGDSPVDVATAKNAGMTSIAVTWGFSPREDIEEANPDYIVDNAEEIAEIVMRSEM
jgi:phosphoglycolate phosphatase